ncbi:MAG: hypothetical protein A3F70_10665 [Acidobacteria bacterium RIFCSPLOWO2_12_FULL_67_14]|nr:MAG: hypothetical protein A3H29_09590 [Acidobacteria bacterium RIFCSPLOWO2_02_FULL_67_21]OFW35163.1 MAG: hypothetical protein A3F70_10665 [Acidobacteria bacterium RIFCSPLOWO2_12_FULL_67_14]
MDFKRVALAAVVAWVVDTIYAMVVWMGILGGEMARFPLVFRSEADMNTYLPLMFVGGLVGMFSLVYVYAKGYEGGAEWRRGSASGCCWRSS